MLWAIASSAFVIYLYRTLNATNGPETTDGDVPADTLGAELAKLSGRIDAIEKMTSGKAGVTTP